MPDRRRAHGLGGPEYVREQLLQLRREALDKRNALADSRAPAWAAWNAAGAHLDLALLNVRRAEAGMGPAPPDA